VIALKIEIAVKILSTDLAGPIDLTERTERTERTGPTELTEQEQNGRTGPANRTAMAFRRA
jgi:hypothetical protein